MLALGLSVEVCCDGLSPAPSLSDSGGKLPAQLLRRPSNKRG